ncbi:hypothetical protein [Pseudochrobactrum asaccharolyticum]|uniref:hypothetical protein n=1 Tax=Pseudochrobactrum asaccharolyticum TaxID=354351 RepID=UPI0040419615
MRILTMEEMSLVVGGGELDARDDGAGGTRGGSNSSGGASDRGKGSATGAKDGYSFDRQVDASKSPGNNPGWDKSVLGGITNTIGKALSGDGSPDYGSYNAMGDYTGGSSSRGDGDSGGRGHD